VKSTNKQIVKREKTKRGDFQNWFPSQPIEPLMLMTGLILMSLKQYMIDKQS